MNSAHKERRLNDAFSTLSGTLVDDYDFVELLQTLVEICRDVTEVTQVGLLLADATGQLDVVASTSENGELVETMQRGAEAGPCHDCFATGRIVADEAIAASPPEWAAFRDAALALGLQSVVAIPMRFRDTTIGVLSLYRNAPGRPSTGDLRAAQSLADVATVGILHERILRESTAVREQLQRALNSRVVIEQAKGVLAQIHGVSTDEAFTLLRGYARANQLNLHDVAARLVDRTLSF